MPVLSAHTASRSFRHIIAAGMTALYLAIICSPLASFAMHSAVTAPVVMRECSGDCNLCGCSPESRASNTCCCSKKRQQQARENDEDGTADCCKKKPVEKKTVIACGCPCGSGKQAALSSSGTLEALPFHFTEQFSTPHTNTNFIILTLLQTSRQGDPPDPPPRLPSFS